jgi:hypothetical protein
MLKETSQSQQLLRRVRSEYLESPGLNLTKPQIRRFLGVDEPTCSELLDALVAAHFLTRTERGQYVIEESHP